MLEIPIKTDTTANAPQSMKWLTPIFILVFGTLTAFSQAHTNHSAALTIGGKQHYSYNVEFSQHGDTTKRMTSYFDNTKRLIRKETTLFRAKPLALYSNTIDDYRTGESIRLTASGSTYKLKRREKTGASTEEKTMSADNAIVGALVSECVAQSLEQITRGEEVQFVLAIPYLGITSAMKLVKTGTETINGTNCIVAKLEASNFFLRTVMGEPSYFTFEQAKPHRLIRYAGLLGLPSPEGAQQSGIAQSHY